MANPFDQFDTPTERATGNVFDRFDASTAAQPTTEVSPFSMAARAGVAPEQMTPLARAQEGQIPEMPRFFDPGLGIEPPIGGTARPEEIRLEARAAGAEQERVRREERAALEAREPALALPSLFESEAGIFAGLDLPLTTTSRAAAALSLAMNPQEMGRILKSAAPDDIYISEYQTSLGNVPVATNLKTGVSISLDQPGEVSPTELAQGVQQVALGLLTRGRSTLGRMGSVAGIETGSELVQAAGGGEFNPLQIGMAVLGQGTSEYALKGLGKWFSRKGQNVDEMAKELTEEASRVGLPSQKTAADIARAAQQGPEELARFVQTDKDVLAAAERVGLRESLTPAAMSADDTFKALSQSLRNIAGSPLEAQERKMLQDAAESADDIIKTLKGSLDTGDVSKSVLKDFTSKIDDIKIGESALYKSIDDQVPIGTTTRAANTIQYFKDRIERAGIESLDPSEIKLYELLKAKGDNAKYGLLEAKRQEVFLGSKGKGAFADAGDRARDSLYSALRADQKAAAEAIDPRLGAQWEEAAGLTSARKGLEKQAQAIFGSNLDKSLVPLLKKVMTDLPKGDLATFNKLMKGLEDLPPETREGMLATSLSNVFSTGSRRDTLNVPGFVDWYTSLNRKPSAKNALMKNLTPGSRKLLDSFYEVNKAIQSATSKNLQTGKVILDIDQAFKDTGNLTAKILDRTASISERVTKSPLISKVPGAGIPSLMVQRTSEALKGDPIDAAMKMMASPKFRNYALKSTGDATEAQVNQAQKLLEKSADYKRWAASLDKASREILKTQGLAGFLGVTTERLAND